MISAKNAFIEAILGDVDVSDEELTDKHFYIDMYVNR